MSRLKTFLLAFAAAMVALPSMAQGVVTFQKDGTRVEAIDSIVTYNYGETPPTGGGSVNDGQNKVFTVNGVSFKMIAVKGGTFQMGSDDVLGARPVHWVTLSDYYIGETEVTQELWSAVMGSNPSHFTGDMQRPVEKVSWDDCQTFISKLNELTGETFRLPTEAQWEYAARGGNKSKGYTYSGSNAIDDVAWYHIGKTYPVKTKAPNELGIYDMNGNVWEWCSDWYGDYSSAAQTDPTGPATGSDRVTRGGCLSHPAAPCRVANRSYYAPANSDGGLGLRLAYNNDEETQFEGGGFVNDGQNKVYTAIGVSFTMIAVKGGTFTMGATSEQTGATSDESPTHNVTLSDYYIGETEVTQELWSAVMGSNPSHFTGDMQRPVEKVSWDDCQTFISKLNELTGETFRLPTEAQWEYAARGGNKSKGYTYSGSNEIDDVAWYFYNSDRTTHPVKTKAPNELGIYDMSGNLVEWCSDWYDFYSSAAQTDPTGPATGSDRVTRGGCLSHPAAPCRVANRSYYAPANSDGGLGLRLAH